jgi:hypothetical protein
MLYVLDNCISSKRLLLRNFVVLYVGALMLFTTGLMIYKPTAPKLQARIKIH